MEGMFLFLLSETFTMMVLNKILGEEEREFLNPGEMERSLICELGNIMCGLLYQCACVSYGFEAGSIRAGCVH